MINYEVLATDCPNGDDCPKVAAGEPGAVAIVGVPIADAQSLAALGVGPGELAVRISEELYRAGYLGLEGRRT